MKKISIVSLNTFALIPTSIFSASVKQSGQAGPYSTVTLVGGNDFKQINSVYDTKSFVNPCTGWDVSYKAMWSAPSAYMVNSAGERRSDTVSLPGTNYYVAENNAGQVGCKYYTKLKPASNQLGSDAITLSLQSDG